jgi:hypothetical protein
MSGLFCLGASLTGLEMIMESLVCEILFRAIKDLKKDEDKYGDDVLAFIQTDWFVTLVEIVGLDPESVRYQIETGTYRKDIPIKATYR